MGNCRAADCRGFPATSFNTLVTGAAAVGGRRPVLSCGRAASRACGAVPSMGGTRTLSPGGPGRDGALPAQAGVIRRARRGRATDGRKEAV